MSRSLVRGVPAYALVADITNMIPAINAAVSGMQSSRTSLDRAAHDIANANTVGHRGAERREQPGALMSTGRPLDLAIQGSGWFRVSSYNGTSFGEILYTRGGDFRRDALGNVATADGRYVIGYALDATGRPTTTEVPIRVPADAASVSISGDGIVTATNASGATTALAAVSLARFRNAEGLEDAGGGLYRVSGNSGAELAGTAGANGLGYLEAAALETSNVELANSIVDSILARHAFSASARAITTVDEMLEEIVRLGRG